MTKEKLKEGIKKHFGPFTGGTLYQARVKGNAWFKKNHRKLYDYVQKNS